MFSKKIFILFLVFIFIIFALYVFKSRDNKEKLNYELGPGVACIYVFNTEYKVEDLAAVGLGGGDHKVINSWNQNLGNFEKVKDGQYFIYDYVCNKDFPLTNLLVDLPKENYADADANSILSDTYKDFYLCKAGDVGVTNYDNEKIISMINDESIFNKCEKL
jgi:hypothetical protein